MQPGRGIALATTVALLLAACAGAGPAIPSPPTQSPTTTATATAAPDPVCDGAEVLATVDAAITSARLPPAGQWSSDTVGNPFAERTATGQEFADRLALDCGLTASDSVGDDERLVIAAWTGPRMAWVIQTTHAPSTPYARDAAVTVVIDATEGEYLDGDTRALWAGTFDSGETFVVGHVDYTLAAAAKGWLAGPGAPSEEEIVLAAERHGIEVLEAAGMRTIGIAQPAEFGSEEGYLQFVSPAGQILVADVAPTGWFDPTGPRYFTGPSRVETIAGVEVRVTEPLPEDNLGFTRGAELGWSCDTYDWILQPPFNGDAAEMIAGVEAIVRTEECRAP